MVVATIQSFRVEDTEQRNVYAFSEAFEPHFRSVPPFALLALQALQAWPDSVVTAADLQAALPKPRPAARFWRAQFASRAGAWPTGWLYGSPMPSSTMRTPQRPSAASRP